MDDLKDALYRALNNEHTVLEFTENDDGSMTITDITEHVERLEEMVENAG